MEKVKLNVFLVSIFLFMLICNSFVPFFADDFSNIMVNGHRLSSFTEVINRASEFYFGWSGRFLTSIFVFLFLFLDKNIFNIINALAFLSMGIIIYTIVILKGKYDYSKIKIFPLAVIYSMIWFSCGCFGEIYFWLEGAIVYFWAVLISLVLVSLIVRKVYDNTYKVNSLLMFILGMIVGGLLENLSVIILFTVFAMVVWDVKNHQIEKWKIWLGIGLLLGFVILIVAPGNYVRNANPAFTDVNHLTVFLGAMKTVARNQWILWLLILTQYVYIVRKSVKCNTATKLGGLFILMSMGMNFIMIASPYFPERTSFPSAIFLIMGVVSLAYENDNFIPRLKNNLSYYLLVIFVACSMVSFGNTLYQYKQLSFENNQREQYVYSEKEKGVMDIRVDPFTASGNRHVFIRDITNDPKNWINGATASYYGINSIVLKQ